MEVDLIFPLLVLLPSLFLDTYIQVDAFQPLIPTSSANAKEDVYIVYLSETPPQGQSSQTFSIEVLSSALGSEKAAKEALIYSYATINGFAAKLTAEQARRVEKQPGIVYVLREKNYTLDDHINA